MAGLRAAISKFFDSRAKSVLRMLSHQPCLYYMNLSRHVELKRCCTQARWPLGRIHDAIPGNGTISTQSYSCTYFDKSHISAFTLYRRSLFLAPCTNGMLNLRSYSSNIGEKPDGIHEVGGSASSINKTGTDGSDWNEGLQLAYQTVIDASSYVKKKAIVVSDEVVPYISQFLDSHPSLKTVIIPVGGTLSAALLAWIVMPKILRKVHEYLVPGPLALLSGHSSQGQVSYHRSVWSALEDPVRYFITFIAFSQLAALIAPNSITPENVVIARRATFVLAFVWFLYRWKTNVFTHALATQSIPDRERLLALDKLSSLGLLVLGLMASAEACGVAVQSILTVGGIGGVATAFAARDILGNVLNGMSMQFTRPFSIGDTIKAGSVEGQVVEIGLTSTSLLNSDKFPVVVPNSFFSNQAIVNKSRARWRAMVRTIPLRISDLQIIPHVSEDIKSMLRSNEKVFLEREAPYCFLSRVENSSAELTIGCNLKHMNREELYATEQDLLLQSVEIIKKHGAELGTTLHNSNSH